MALVVKNLLTKAGDIRDMAVIPRTGRFPREGNGNQYSSLGNPNRQKNLAGYSPWGQERARHNSAAKQQEISIYLYICIYT